ncbi:hypothetical protein LTR12_007275 [Friedmanniomyces endolithicus]|nr:hypothetical protein LTR12_007275 [Friedmanniomyces endolithicus]
MAVTTKQSRNAAKVRLDSVEEESWRPANNKRTISLAGIFDEIRNKRQKGGDVGDDGIQRSPPPRKAVAKTTPRNEEHSGARETGSAAGEFFAQFVSKKKHAQNPIYRDFDGLESQAMQISRGWKQKSGLCRNLCKKRKWTLRSLKQTATSLSNASPLGSVLQGYKKLCIRKNKELQSLEQELGRLDEDIAAAYDTLSDERDLTRAKEHLDADLARFKQASKAAKDQLAAEFEQARSEDKAASVETNEKIKEFMRALQ